MHFSKSLLSRLLLLLLIMPTFNLSAESSSPLEARLQTELAKRPDLAEKESFVKTLSARVQKRVDTLISQGKSSAEFARFATVLSNTREPVSISSGAIDDMNTKIRAGKISLQARAIGPTPVLYTGSFSEVFGGVSGTGLLLDEYHQIDPVEFVALSGTVFHIVGVLSDNEQLIYQVTSSEYPYETDRGYYIDARFVDTYWVPLGELGAREKSLPSREAILEHLHSSLGLPYIWGGDVPTGVPKLLEYYPPKASVPDELRAKWTLRGVDCSGLLYAATDGATPRNTSSLVSYGTGLTVAGKTAVEIVALLQPLDILAWKGHTLIVLDN